MRAEFTEAEKYAYNDGLLDGLETFLQLVRQAYPTAEESVLRALLACAYKDLEEH